MANPAPLRLTLFINADGNQLTATIGGAQNQLNHLGQTGRQAGEGLNAGFRGIIGTLSSLIAAFGAFQLSEKIIRDTAVVEDLNTRLTALTAAGKDYAETMEYINTVADAQHKDLIILSDGYAKLRVLQNSGLITGTQTKAMFEGINNAASRLGGTDKLKDIFYGLAQGLASGTLHAEELNQVMEPLPGLMQSIDAAAGLQAGGFRKLVNDGKVTSDMFAKTLVKALRDYDGAAAATANNINAKSADIKNAWTRLIMVIDEPVNDSISPVMVGAKQALDATRIGVIALMAEMPTAEQAVMNIEGVNISAASAVKGAWVVALQGLHDEYVILEHAGVVAAAQTAWAWVNSGDQMLTNAKTIGNAVIGVFITIGHSIGQIFAVAVMNIQRSFDNVTAYAKASAADIKNAAYFNLSFSNVRSVQPQPLINGSADLLSTIKADLSVDYLGNLKAVTQGAALSIQQMTNEEVKAREAAKAASGAANDLASAHAKVAGAATESAEAHKKAAKAKSDAEKASKKLADAYAQELKSLDDEHAKLTKNERDYFLYTQTVKGFNAAQQQILLGKFDLAKADEVAKKTADAKDAEMKKLVDKYNQLTLSARAYYVETLRLQGIIGKNAAPLLTQFDKNAGLVDQQKKQEEAKRALDSYNQSLNTAKQSLSGLGSVSSSVFDAQLGGLNAMIGAWSAMTTGINDNTQALEELHQKQQLNLDTQKINGVLTAEGAANAEKYAKREIELTGQKTLLEIDGARQIAASAAQMFGEKTAAAKAFHAVEMVLAIASIAMKAQEIAASTAATGVKLAEGAATLFAESGWLGFAGVAAMLAVMAGLGYAASGAGSSVQQPPKASPDTGTVLGDTTAQSQSIGNIIKTLNDIHASEYPQLIGINSGITNLQSALTGTITTLFQAGGLDTSNAGLGIGSMPISINPAVAITGISLINDLFSGGYRSVEQRGIQTDAQAIGGIISGVMLNAVQYIDIKIREWDLFGDSTRYETVFTSLDAKIVKSLGQVFESAGQVSLSLAEQLGGNLAAKVKGYVIPSLKIDLTGLNADDASKKINAVLSTALDTMATDIFGGLVGKYQQIGEGMLETATRIVSEMAVVGDALHQSGLSMGADAMAISDALAQAAGGLKAFQDQFATFYDKFYTDTEKQARLQATLSAQLQSVFLGLPDTRAAYRDLIEALNLNNVKDRERYSLLIKLASSADTYYASLENGLKTYQDGVKSSYDTAANLLKGQVDTYRNFVTQLKSFSDSLVTGSLSTSNPADKYLSAKSEYLSVKSVLATGTDAQKETALEKLQSVTQTYLEASKAYNASGLGYVKDFADAQAVLAREIGNSADKADMAQAQLDKLTAQVTALGLINQSVLSVKDAVDAFSTAMVGLQKAQEAQAGIAADNKNRAAFGAIESGRKAAYEAPIATRAAAVGAAVQKSEGMLGWSDNTSKSAFSAEAVISAATGAVVSGESYQSSSGHAGDVVNSLRTGGFENVRAQFAYIGKTIEALVGGTLPDIYVKLAGGGGNGNAMYTFAGQTRSVQGDNIDPLVRLFANDATDYLADHLGNAAWVNQIKAVSFASLNSGFTELTTLMAHLKHPYQASTYNDKVDYTKLDGSHRDGLESVPFDGYVAELHKGERVLTAQESVDYAANQSVSVVFARPAWLDELLHNPAAPVKADAVGEDKSAKVAAMVGLQKTQEVQAVLAADNKNRAAFGAIESGRKAAFSAEAVISAATGAVVSGESYQSSSGHAGDVVNSLRTGGFENVRAQFAYIGKTIETLVGGTLPDIYVKLAGGGGNGNAMYTFAGQTRSVQGDNIDPLVRLFANDATDYLADHLGNAAWANQIKAVSFASLNSGFTELTTLMAHLKHPYQASTYNDKVDYTKLDGSHRDGLESVPFDGYVAELHKGERVLTAQESVDYAASQSVSVVFARPAWLDELLRNPAAPVKADAAGEDKSAKTLELCLAELRKLNKQAAESVAVERAGFLQAIAALEAQIELMQQANRQSLRVVREK